MPNNKIKTVMHEFKEGALHSGSRHGPVVTNRMQAIAIAMREAGMPPRTHENAHSTKMSIQKHPQHHMGYKNI